nr:hypothetical protein [Saprospiraceae bacterium]
KSDNYQAQQKRGNYLDVAIFEEKLIKEKHVYFDRFPSQTISDAPLAINPLNSDISPSPLDKSGFDQIQKIVNLANKNNISTLNVNITMSISPDLNNTTFQSNLRNEFGKTFGFNGTINLNVTAKAGEVGAVSISSPGSTVRKEKEVQKIARVQTGVKSEFKP